MNFQLFFRITRKNVNRRPGVPLAVDVRNFGPPYHPHAGAPTPDPLKRIQDALTFSREPGPSTTVSVSKVAGSTYPKSSVTRTPLASLVTRLAVLLWKCFHNIIRRLPYLSFFRFNPHIPPLTPQTFLRIKVVSSFWQSLETNSVSSL